MTKKLVDRQGVEVRLGREIARGGEGVVFDIEGRQGFVAKLYHRPPESDKVSKLAVMVQGRTQRLLDYTAWPLELLSETRGGPTLGVVMPRIDGFRDIHLLYGPKSRLSAFPLAGWPFLIRAAANLARAFAVVHEHGHVIGDVNDKVALVSDQALVKLLDCDSFQIRYGKGVFTCDVGVLTHQPPELQGKKSFRGLVRTQNHDSFGLAVLVFQLLFLARHPFSGTYAEGDMPLERAIKEHRFVYGADAARRGMAPPPCSLELSVLTRELIEMFEHSFSAKGVSRERPKARDWVRALDRLGAKVRRCQSNPCHAYLKGHSCPFCALERRYESTLFNLPILARNKAGRQRTLAVNVASLWKEIVAVDAPSPLPKVSADFLALAQQSAAGLRRRRRGRSAAIVIAAASVLGIPFTGGWSLPLCLLAPVPWWKSRGPRKSVELARRCAGLERRAQEEKASDAFQKQAADLQHARKELEGLDKVHETKLHELEKHRRPHQLDAFLDGQRIANSSIPDLGPGLKTMLESYGVETAKDVSAPALGRVPGLSAAARRSLLAWRSKHEDRFVFDPNRGVDPAALAALEHEIQQRRAHLVQELADGPARLRNCARQVEMRRKAIENEIASLIKEGAKRAA